MTIAEIEELIRKYLATGIAVVVVLVAPGTTIDRSALPSGSQVITVDPTRPSATPGPRPTPTPAPAPAPAPDSSRADDDPGDRTGAGGSDPGTADESPATGSENPEASAGQEESAGQEDGSSGSDSGGAGTGSAPSTSEGTTAAATLGWGTPNREDDFSSGADQWSLYDGAGHGGQGRRSPSAVSVSGGVLTLTGDSSGTTAGMAWNPGQKYGRWEGRVKAPASDPSYNALLLLWPDAEDWPSGGEVDFMEMSDPSRQETNMFLHYGADNQQLNGKVQIDATQWHNWAVEWTPDAITAYVDGKEWFRTTDKSTFPPGPMHLCIQLDWFPQGGGAKESTMQVDWVRQYPVDGGGGSSGSGNADSGSDGTDEPSGIRNFLRRMFSWG